MLRALLSMLRPLGATGGTALTLGLLAALALGWNAVLLATAAIAPASVSEPPAEQQKERITRYETGLDRRVAQINGRSMFIAPRPPKAPEASEEKQDDKPPPPPATYGGPGLVAMVYDRVWFDDGRVLGVGDPEDSGLAVVDVSPPWIARLRWRGVEFDVTLFSRTTPEFLAKPEGEKAGSEK